MSVREGRLSMFNKADMTLEEGVMKLEGLKELISKKMVGGGAIGQAELMCTNKVDHAIGYLRNVYLLGGQLDNNFHPLIIPEGNGEAKEQYNKLILHLDQAMSFADPFIKQDEYEQIIRGWP